MWKSHTVVHRPASSYLSKGNDKRIKTMKRRDEDPTGAVLKHGRPKAAVLLAEELRRQIVSGRLEPGDRLKPEAELQREFNVSRPTLREALRLLEAESLISIVRGKYGGAQVSSLDLGNIARQVGVALQIEGTQLADVWLARTVIEPAAARMLAESRNETALSVLEANIAEAKEASQNDVMRYAGLSAEFSILILQHCGSNTLHLLASLIFDIIRRQHEHVTQMTLSKASVSRLRQKSIESRIRAVELMRTDSAVAVETFWRAHLLEMRDLVLKVYDGSATIDILRANPTKMASRMTRRAETPPVGSCQKNPD